MLNKIFEEDKIVKTLLSTLSTKLRRNVTSKNLAKKFIFICGKQIDENKDNVRRWLTSVLEKNDVNIKCLIAEDLYFSTCDLLTFENLLAEISDYIIIILESPGTFCELGAFVNNQTMVDKIIVINEDNPRYEKSFISLGPLRKLNNNNLVLYQGKLNQSPDVHRMIERVKTSRTSGVLHNKSSGDLELKALIYELLNIVYLFTPICDYEVEIVYKKIYNIGKYMNIKNHKQHGINDIKQLLKLLFKLDMIEYKNGYYYSKDDMKMMNFAFLQDELQISSIRSQYLSRLYKLDKERMKI